MNLTACVEMAVLMLMNKVDKVFHQHAGPRARAVVKLQHDGERSILAKNLLYVGEIQYVCEYV